MTAEDAVAANGSAASLPVPALEADALEKWYGPLPAVRGVAFHLPPGEFLTLYGPNGAGKSTLLRMLAGVVRPTRGTVRIGGEAVHGGGGAWRHRLGMLSHQTFLYSGLSAEENLHFYGRLYALSELADRCAAMLQQFGLWQRRHDRVHTFSRGMQQRLALARTLLHNPAVVFLDEPYTGLDAHAAGLLRHTLEHLKDGARTVLLITHNLSQGLELADRVAVQVAGRWIHDEPRRDLNPARFEAWYTDVVGSAL